MIPAFDVEDTAWAEQLFCLVEYFQSVFADNVTFTLRGKSDAQIGPQNGQIKQVGLDLFVLGVRLRRQAAGDHVASFPECPTVGLHDSDLGSGLVVSSVQEADALDEVVQLLRGLHAVHDAKLLAQFLGQILEERKALDTCQSPPPVVACLAILALPQLLATSGECNPCLMRFMSKVCQRKCACRHLRQDQAN